MRRIAQYRVCEVKDEEGLRGEDAVAAAREAHVPP